MTRRFEVGDKVEYRAAFLRSIGWVTNVSTGGVIDAAPNQHIVRVRWPDGRTVSVNTANLIHKEDLHKEAP